MFDAKRYREEVLRAMAHGWRPSDDLFRCYQLLIDVADETVIAKALKQVQGHVNGLRGGGEWATLLRKQHSHAQQTLMTPALREQHRQQVLQRRRDLVPLRDAALVVWKPSPRR